MKKIIALIIALPIMVHAVEHKAVDRFNNALNTYVAQPSPDNAALVLAELTKSQGNEKLREIFATRLDLKAVNVNDLNQQVRMFKPEAEFVDFSVPKHVTVRPTLASEKNKDAFEKKKILATAQALVDEKTSADSTTISHTKKKLDELKNRLQAASPEERERIFNEITKTPDDFIRKTFPLLQNDTKGGEKLMVPLTADIVKDAIDKVTETIKDTIKDLKPSTKEPTSESSDSESKTPPEAPVDLISPSIEEQEEQRKLAALEKEADTLEENILKKEGEAAELEISILNTIANASVVAGVAQIAAGMLKERIAADSLNQAVLKLKVAFAENKMKQAEVAEKIQKMIIGRLEKTAVGASEAVSAMRTKIMTEAQTKSAELARMKTIFQEFGAIAQNELNAIASRATKGFDALKAAELIETGQKSFNEKAENMYVAFKENAAKAGEKATEAGKKIMTLTEEQQRMLTRAYDAAKKEIPQAKAAVTQAFKKFEDASRRLIQKNSLTPEAVQLLNKAQGLLSVIKNKFPK